MQGKPFTKRYRTLPLDIERDLLTEVRFAEGLQTQLDAELSIERSNVRAVHEDHTLEVLTVAAEGIPDSAVDDAVRRVLEDQGVSLTSI